MTVAVCIKWVDSHPDVDPLTGAVRPDPRTSGMSAHDEAALEWALRLSSSVVALTAGPPGASAVLRTALGAGATTGVRVEMDPSLPSAVVAAALATAMPPDVDLVLCGVESLDRGSGSVPAFLAARLDAAQLLGLVSLTADTAERRLDRGRRERLAYTRPAVLSVEGGSARLRRAPLSSVIAARTAPITTVAGPVVAAAPARTFPFRPRPRWLAPPAGSSRERILSLTGALTSRTPPQQLVLDPVDAAARIREQLTEWGYTS